MRPVPVQYPRAMTRTSRPAFLPLRSLLPPRRTRPSTDLPSRLLVSATVCHARKKINRKTSCAVTLLLLAGAARLCHELNLNSDFVCYDSSTWGGKKHWGKGPEAIKFSPVDPCLTGPCVAPRPQWTWAEFVQSRMGPSLRRLLSLA